MSVMCNRGFALFILACRDGATWCPVVHTGNCYTSDDICCATCSAARTNIEGLLSTPKQDSP